MTKFASARSICTMLLVSGLLLTACKGKTSTDSQAPPPTSPTTPDTAVTTNSTTAIQIESTDSLQIGVKDATKDYPMVHASVDDGVITLTGEIKRSELPKLMQTIHSLHPKKVTNNLTIK